MGKLTPRRGRRASALALAMLPVLAGIVVNPAGAVAADDDDDDDLRVSLVSPSNVICWEKPNPLDSCRVTVGLSRTVPAPVTVTFATLDGTARAPADYRAVTERLTIPAGRLTVDVEVSVEDDGVREPDEWFHTTIAEPSRGQVRVGRATITIGDGAPPADR